MTDDEQYAVRPETDLQEGNSSPDSTEDYRREFYDGAGRYEIYDDGIDPDTGLPYVMP